MCCWAASCQLRGGDKKAAVTGFLRPSVMALFLELYQVWCADHGVSSLNLQDSVQRPLLATLPTINFKICPAALNEIGCRLATTSPLLFPGSSLAAPGSHYSTFCLYICLFWAFTQACTYEVWSYDMWSYVTGFFYLMLSRLIYTLACTLSTPFLVLAEQWPTVWIETHSVLLGQLVSFWVAPSLFLSYYVFLRLIVAETWGTPVVVFQLQKHISSQLAARSWCPYTKHCCHCRASQSMFPSAPRLFWLVPILTLPASGLVFWMRYWVMLFKDRGCEYL